MPADRRKLNDGDEIKDQIILVPTLADLLGHNDLKTTMRYMASTETDKAAKMAGMD